MRKKISTDPRALKLQRKRFVTELSTMPFVVPEDEYGAPRPAIHAVPHPLTPEFMSPPPEGRLRSALRSRGWRRTGLVAAMIAGLALLALELFPDVGAAWLDAATTSTQDTLRAFLAEPAPVPAPAIEAATKIAEDFERLNASRAALAGPQRDTDATLNRLMEWDRNAAATPAQ